MLRFSHTAVGVQQGTEMLFTAFEDGGPMWTGSGPRVERCAVRFPTPFLGVPAVHVGLSMWDIAMDSNQRVDFSADEITPQGFVILFRTWGDTRVARARVSWMAIGPTEHEDDFLLD